MLTFSNLRRAWPLLDSNQDLTLWGCVLPIGSEVHLTTGFNEGAEYVVEMSGNRLARERSDRHLLTSPVPEHRNHSSLPLG